MSSLTLPTALIDKLVERAASATPFDEAPPSDIGLPPQLPKRDLEMAEHAIGRSFPLALAQLWTAVANGGFGPGYGITGLTGGHISDPSGDALSYYMTMKTDDPHDDSWRWPERMIAFCNWGCAVHSCIDMSTLDARVYRFDPNNVSVGWRTGWFNEGTTLQGWLEAWINGDELWMSPAIAPVEDILAT